MTSFIKSGGTSAASSLRSFRKGGRRERLLLASRKTCRTPLLTIRKTSGARAPLDLIHPTSLQKRHVFQYALYHWCGEESGALLLVFHCIRERLNDLGSAGECTVCLALVTLFLVHLP